MSVRSIFHVLLVGAGLILTISATSLAPVVAASGAPAVECVPNPARSLVVATVPRVQGFAFQVDERRYRTGRSGTVRIEPVTCPEGVEALAPITEKIDQGNGTTATFDAWYGSELIERERGDGTLYAAFSQDVQVDLKLVDLADRPVARDAVGTIVIKGSTGALEELKPGDSTLTLHASRVVRFSNGLVSKDILWSVQSADVEGNTAVNRGQVRFEPRKTRSVTVPLMLFTLRVAVRDVILRRSVGDRVVVVSPDGSKRGVRLDSEASGEVAALARGHYLLRASGGSIAMGFEQPVAVSRPQEAELTVISRADLIIAGGAVFSVAIGLLVVGWRLRGRAGRPKQPVAPLPEEHPEGPAVRDETGRSPEKATT
ncbi:hypothetical protein [Nocardioides piscis]|uniref:Uncharacterized protein n=1 Tax=Nocardioides piscis TaxID=2714938 RepID=A0A6G7YBT6_9ACTN|nr:hypothetical protein [Nocardioides piscis]QIK74282.1 hypothetical protein G7071_01350 [Nocardioides piscis]